MVDDRGRSGSPVNRVWICWNSWKTDMALSQAWVSSIVIDRRVEAEFATLKKENFSGTRDVGCAEVNLQLMFSAMAFNLKKAAKMAA